MTVLGNNDGIRRQWVYVAGLAHVLADEAGCVAGLVTVCGLEVAATVPVYRVPPSLDVCRSCERPGALDVPPPAFPATPSVF